MVRRSIVLEKQVEQPVQTQTCQHYWIIEPAVGPTSKGVCKRCGSVKIFLNIVEDSQPRETVNKIFTSEELEEKDEEDEGDEGPDDADD